ncbi:MAG: rod shape-determining protein MreC [Gammaproteobacteria bacterium]|nr:rod shape-determining protein MreC [Gammaproteobacteria bacterium]MBU1416051.1 rod shape-determining protein MreC [Gammaproteobacteria bacterium]
MPTAGHSPPPFFKRGPAPLARLLFFVSLSFVMLAADLRFHTLEMLRQAIATIIWPIQRVAYVPVDAGMDLSEYFSTLYSLKTENDQLRRRELATANQLLRQGHLEEENRRLRALLDMRERQPAEGRVAEILYAARDPFTRRVIVDKGSSAGVEPGQPVIDELGVLGQITRTYPLTSEVTLLTDKDQAIPVQVQRSGLRAVLAGAGIGALELRFLAANADIQPGDILVTSGLDGVYLPGLPVARIVNIDRDNSFSFARIDCEPLAGVERHGQVLILGRRLTPPLPDERPLEPVTPARGARNRKAP